MTLGERGDNDWRIARALRIEIAGGRYPVTSRGNERRAIFRQDRDRVHFLELLSQLPSRFVFGLRLDFQHLESFGIAWHCVL